MEACLHLPHRSQRQRLRALLIGLGVTALTEVPDGQFWQEVLDWLIKYAEHEPDWADGCIAVLSGRDKRLAVWTCDREFQRVWRRPDGTAIPLAVS